MSMYNSIHKATFETAPSGETFAIGPITLPSGLAIRAGDIIPSDAAELYVQHVQDTTQHSRKQEILSSFLVPSGKSQKLTADSSRIQPSRCRRQVADEDDKSISSFDDERSVLSVAADAVCLWHLRQPILSTSLRQCLYLYAYMADSSYTGASTSTRILLFRSVYRLSRPRASFA
jgi:hypothetical protein